jgi:hypothetical protein
MAKDSQELTDTIEQLYSEAATLLRQSPIAAADYITLKAEECRDVQGSSLATSVFRPLFFSSVYHKAREHLYNQLGIKFSGSYQADLDTLGEYCRSVGADLSLRLHSLSGKQNALGTYPQELYSSMVQIAMMLKGMADAAGQETVKVTDDNLKIIFNGLSPESEPEKKQAESSDMLLNRLISYFILEREHIKEFESDKGAPDAIAGSDRLTKINSKGVLSYRAEECPGFSEVIGPLIMLPCLHRFGYKIFFDFYQEIAGSDKIASPIVEWKLDKHCYQVMREESMDQEVFLLDPAVPKYDKFRSFADNLMSQVDLEDALKDYTSIIDDETAQLTVKIFEGVVDVKLKFNNPVHDYVSECLTSMVLGRKGELNRLAKRREFREGEDGRTYVAGSNPKIDRLLDEARDFAARYLAPEQLSFLSGFTNLDSQPSNYFINGKINDVDRVNYANSMYMAARLLGHPSAEMFFDSLSPEEKKGFMEKYVEESDHPFIQASRNPLKEGKLFPDEPLFGLYAARKLQESGVVASDEVLSMMETSFAAHKAWISAGQTLSYCGRVRDPKYAAEYLEVAQKYLDDPRFEDFREAYMDSLSASRHHGVLESIASQDAPRKCMAEGNISSENLSHENMVSENAGIQTIISM